ncbi:MAG: cysteine--tRNA ligase, partial [Actinomycetota bacterium]|nr:cysteine--tRNA ligase [Actinomycetota bacterium]
WGWGRPGWHAECAAMALAVLGRGVDVLAGGEDLRYPHHAYQAALGEAATSTSPFTRSALHVGAVRRDGTKMAKSTGNLVLVSDLLQFTTPAAVRLLLLDRPWTTAWDYTDDLLSQAAARLERLYTAAGRPSRSPTAQHAVTGALLDNLNVPRAVAIAEHDGGDAARHLLRVLALS